MFGDHSRAAYIVDPVLSTFNHVCKYLIPWKLSTKMYYRRVVINSFEAYNQGNIYIK